MFLQDNCFDFGLMHHHLFLSGRVSVKVISKKMKAVAKRQDRRNRVIDIFIISRCVVLSQSQNNPLKLHGHEESQI